MSVCSIARARSRSESGAIVPSVLVKVGGKASMMISSCRALAMMAHAISCNSRSSRLRSIEAHVNQGPRIARPTLRIVRTLHRLDFLCSPAAAGRAGSTLGEIRDVPFEMPSRFLDVLNAARHRMGSQSSGCTGVD